MDSPWSTAVLEGAVSFPSMTVLQGFPVLVHAFAGAVGEGLFVVADRPALEFLERQVHYHELIWRLDPLSRSHGL
jgi:biotin carboxylase